MNLAYHTISACTKLHSRIIIPNTTEFSAERVWIKVEMFIFGAKNSSRQIIVYQLGQNPLICIGKMPLSSIFWSIYNMI
jgi:hypothetical protein